ncbi:MAG: hypothetical protein ACRD2S_08685 [Terriglobales bacterium]
MGFIGSIARQRANPFAAIGAARETLAVPHAVILTQRILRVAKNPNESLRFSVSFSLFTAPTCNIFPIASNAVI